MSATRLSASPRYDTARAVHSSRNGRFVRTKRSELTGNNLSHAWSRFVVVMIGAPGEPMLTLVDDAELALRRDRRASRPA